MNLSVSLSDSMAVLLLAIGLGLCVWQARLLALGAASGEWRRTKGTVLKAYVDESTDEDGDTTHSAHVLYAYKVGSRRFESTRLSYQPTDGLAFSTAVDLLHGITQGREVDVYYDPRQPERAVLIPGRSRGNVTNLVLTVALALLALWHVLS